MADTFLVIGTGPTVNIVLSGAGTPYTAGTGIAVSGANVISNTAPDQTVTMTDGTGIDVTGTYPDFTVTNTSPNVVQTLSIAGQDLTLSGGGGTVAIPGGASDALGTGFTSGGGAGTIPELTKAQINLSTDWGDFAANVLYGPASYYEINQGDGLESVGIETYDENTGAYAFVGVKSDDPTTVYTQAGDGGVNNSSATISPLSVVFTSGGDLQFASTSNIAEFFGGLRVGQFTSAAAPNNCIFYSTTVSKLCYKDPGGTVNPLY